MQYLRHNTIRSVARNITSMSSSHPRYELLYHPGIPGRGEYIRLAFEAAGVKYVDVATQEEGGYAKVQALMDPKSTGDGDGNPVCFAPPMLRVQGAGKNGKDLVIHQSMLSHFPIILTLRMCLVEYRHGRVLWHNLVDF